MILNMGYFSEVSEDLQNVKMADLRIFEGINGLVWDGKLIIDDTIEIKVGNPGRGGPNIYGTKTKKQRTALKRIKRAAALALGRNPDNEECLDWLTAYMVEGDDAAMHIGAIVKDFEN